MKFVPCGAAVYYGQQDDRMGHCEAEKVHDGDHWCTVIGGGITYERNRGADNASLCEKLAQAEQETATLVEDIATAMLADEAFAEMLEAIGEEPQWYKAGRAALAPSHPPQKEGETDGR